MLIFKCHRSDSPALWTRPEYFHLADETFRPSLHPLWLNRAWMPEPSVYWQEAPKSKEAKSIFTERLNKTQPQPGFPIKHTAEAHLFVQKDPVEFSWWGEKRFFQCKFTGGDLDAGVDGSGCAGRGGNLFHTSIEVWWARISLCAITKAWFRLLQKRHNFWRN